MLLILYAQLRRGAYTMIAYEYFDAQNITIRIGDIRKLRAR